MEKGEGYKVEKGREKSRENIVTDMEGENCKKEVNVVKRTKGRV